MRGFTVATSALALVLTAGTALGQVSQRAFVVVKVGDVFGPLTVSSLNSPFTNDNGQVGFVAAFGDASRGIWFDNAFIFNSSDLLPDTATGGEGSMGIGNAGGFIYSPSFNAKDAVVTQGGKLLADDDVFPPDPAIFSAFNSRPSMIADGTAYWIAGTASALGGATTNRHLVKAPDPTDPASIAVVLSGGDIIDGKAISTAASNFTYDISDNGLHHVHELDMVTGSTTNNLHIYVDGAFVMQEGSPTGGGDNWETFDDVSINNSGDYLVGGTTNAATGVDGFLAYNGAIALREGSSTVDGILLATGATIRACSLNNDGHAASIWGWGSGTTLQEHLFYGRTADLANSRRLLSVGGGVDTDGDNVADYTITDLEASGAIGPGLDLGESGFVFVEVSMTDGVTEVEAILKVPVCPADYNADGFVDGIDYDQFNNDFESFDPAQQVHADFNDDGFVDGIDYDQFMIIFETGC